MSGPRLRDRVELVARLAETWIRRPSSPTRAVVSITRRCNLRCEMCLTWARPPAVEALSAEAFGDVFAQMDRLTWLDVTGGEPFVRKDAELVFDAIVANTPALRMLHFPTNGWFGDRVVDTARRLRDARPESDLIITVSVDGPEEVHDTVRGRKGAFRRAVDTFRRLRDLPGVSAYVGTTVTRTTQPHIEALGQTLEAAIPGFGADEWHWNWLQESEQFFANQGTELRPEPSEALVDAHLRRRGLPRTPVDLMEFGFLVNLERYLDGQPTGIDCQSLRSTCFISPEGDLYPCHVWDRPLGNLTEHRFAELWNAPETLRARGQVERLECGGCFTPCEAYPALAGSPVRASATTLAGAARAIARGLRST